MPVGKVENSEEIAGVYFNTQAVTFDPQHPTGCTVAVY